MSSLSFVPSPKPEILNVPLYVPGKSKGNPLLPIYKLSSNESPLGPSPKAQEAYLAAVSSLHRYPDGSAHLLREALGELYGLPASQIVCGAGSDQIFELLAKAYLQKGDEAIYSQHGFLVYPMVILTQGATPIVAEETLLTADPEQILAKVTSRTKMVFLANPNNPTGTYLKHTALQYLVERLPKNCLLVLDEAYGEYVTEEDYRSGLTWAQETQNVVVTRTFSKIYGLAGIRLGWAFCPEAVAQTLNRIRDPFNVSNPALQAGVAALKDQAHIAAARAHNLYWRGWLKEALEAIGLEVTPSVANFLLVHFSQTLNHPAAAVEAALGTQNIFVRKVDAYGFPDALRISIGEEDALKQLITALGALISGQHR